MVAGLPGSKSGPREANKEPCGFQREKLGAPWEEELAGLARHWSEGETERENGCGHSGSRWARVTGQGHDAAQSWHTLYPVRTGAGGQAGEKGLGIQSGTGVWPLG